MNRYHTVITQCAGGALAVYRSTIAKNAERKKNQFPNAYVRELITTTTLVTGDLLKVSN